MASAAGYQIAREKYRAKSTSATLQGEVEQQASVQHELRRAQETHRAVTAQISRAAAEDSAGIAMQQVRFTEIDYMQNKMKILLHGFESVVSIFQNITFIAALVMGYSAALFRQQDVINTERATRWTFWMMGLGVVLLMLHVIWVATLALTDATELAYQGPKGMADLLRAFKGLMEIKDEVFANFIAGFVLFVLLIAAELWVKLDADTPIGEWLADNAIVFGGIVSGLYVIVPLGSMLFTARRLTRQFEVREADPFFRDAAGRLPTVELGEEDLQNPAARRRRARQAAASQRAGTSSAASLPPSEPYGAR
eukprot:TRINITY_DN51815_c0_g1_i1.p1 TRINITY_DN51815_c0_g1~~TRINITY_DN51815_c0_g1_i1.p1  ORF type:complete len:310 (+),score=124.93 TRINITY_DN51815_c0_g1_i1:80-1009(+)